MSDEFKKVQIMFEQIRSDVKAIAEGHSVLLNAINRVDNKLEEFRNETEQNFRKFRSDLTLHTRQTVPPAHIGV